MNYDLEKELSDSEEVGETLFQWWNHAHEINHGHLLSGTAAESTWDCLDIKNYLHPGVNVLEIGVGFGYSLKALDKKGCKVSALDISPLALKKYRLLNVT